MAKSTPEKLAQALRANLKRRKQAKAVETKEPPTESAPKPGQKLSKSPQKAED
jgi:hypothetical protein